MKRALARPALTVGDTVAALTVGARRNGAGTAMAFYPCVDLTIGA
ncbi:hypothetical protein [Paractinoplanes abujensis]|uniref:Uncharacterized protein n=1 Tax=Paractinoplanes abujensis TaxID=882441 RepID=A0A7W7G3F4_9ACTN|nr:hypothetical protein [Actinoplanes abujensis]MBB4694614.1 hypothetical protein [Actinoplanes abujensis]